MWYLKVSSSLLIAVALICTIQNTISLTLDQTTEDQWSKLASSTDQIDLKKILKLCRNSINSFNGKLENTKTIVNKKLPEPNQTTEDIENLVNDVKTQIKNSSADLVAVRKFVQKTALRFRDTFKSLASFTELDNESVNKELEGIKKTTVDSKKPLVNRVVRSFGNRYDLNKLANKVLEISADREKLKNNYDEKKKIAKKELNSLWNSLTNHSKTVNDNALKAFETLFEGMKSLKSVKKKVKIIGEDAINEIKKEDDFNKIKNAVELAKALKLKFEDEWNLDSGELTYSEEQKKDTTKTPDENPVEDNEYDNSINDIQPSLPTTEQETIDNEKINAIPSTQVEIEKPSKDDSFTSDKAISKVEETQLPSDSENKVQTTKLQPTIKDNLPDDKISDNINSPIEETSITPNTENKENKEKTIMVEPKVLNNETNPTDGIKSDLSNNETSLNPDITNDEKLISPNKNAVNNKKNKIINKRTSREKIPILPWQKLIQLDDPQVSQQSKQCESLLNNITPDFNNIKKSAKNSIQVTKNYKTLQKIENDTVQRFYEKMVDTNTKLSDYLVNSAEDVCAKVTPINKRYETKFKNDPNIKRIKYLLGKQYDPNQYILKILDDASHKNGIGGMKKTTYYKMLAVAHNLNHETKEMEAAALYAMNKIYEGKLAATNIQKMFNKEKASKACYIRNILLEKENDAEKKNKDENKEKVKESINNDTNTEPLKPDVNLDSIDDIQPLTINDDNEPTLNNEEEKKTLNDTNESTTHNNLGDNEKENISDEKENTKKQNEEQNTEENYNISSIPQNKDSATTTQTTNDGANTPKHKITRKVTHHRKHKNPNDPNDVSEEYDTIEEISDEEDVTNEYKSSEKKSNMAPEAESLINSNNKHEIVKPKHSENENVESNEENSIREKTTKEGAQDEHKTNRHIKRTDPKDRKETSEEYEEDGDKLKKSGEKTFDDTEKSKAPVTADNLDNTEAPEHLENENVESNEENSTPVDTSEGNNSGESKNKRRRKQIDPKDGKEISEEYEEEVGDKLNKSGEKTFDDTEKSKAPVTADNLDNTEAPEHLENENVESNEEKSTPAETSEENNSGESKKKRRRKRINPNVGKEISEEYEEEDGDKLNKSGEKTYDDTEKSKAPVTADNLDNTEAPEHLENENVESNEEKSTPADTSEENNSGESKKKRRRKRINPIDGKEISEEYEEEDGDKLNKSGEKTFDDTEKSKAPVTADNLDNTEAPEHLENENVESNEEKSTPAETSEENNSGESKKKRRRKRINPNDGKEISEEYEEEDGDKLNKSGEKTYDDTEKSKAPVTADNLDNTEAPEYLENENVESNEEKSTPADTSEENNSGESKKKRRRKRINPIDGKEISEEYEEEDGDKLNKSGEKTFDDTEKSKAPVTADNLDNTEAPEHLENENVESNEENSTPAETSEENNSGESKKKRRRKRINPIDGKEISEEYEEEDGDKLNKSGEKTFDDTEKSKAPVTADNLDNTEAPEHLENENVESNEEKSTPADTSEGNNSGESKNKRQRKRIDPKDGKEISEEYEEEDGDKLNKSGEKTFDDTEKSKAPVTADNLDNTEAPEHLENENVESNEEKSTPADTSEENNSGESKKKRRRKRINPNDGKEISEEYEEEDGDKLNKSGEKTYDDTEKSKAPVTADNLDNTEAPKHLENENVESNEENSTPADKSEENNSDESKNKRRRKRIDPKDGKELSNETDTFEEDENDLSKSIDKQSNDTFAIAPPVNKENNSEQDTEEENINTDITSMNKDNTKENLNKEFIENDEKVDQENKTNEKEDLDVNENLNSVEDAELKSVNNDKIIPAEESMGEYSTSYESSYESPEQSQLDTSNKKPDNNKTMNINQSNENKNIEEQESKPVSTEIPNVMKEQNNPVDQFHKNPRRNRKGIDPRITHEVSKEYDTVKEKEEDSTEFDNKIAATSENTDYNQSNEHEPEKLIDEVTDEPSEIDEQNKENNQPNRRHRKRKDPKTGLEVSEEYNTLEEQDEEPPLEDSKVDTPEHNKNPEYNQSNKHEPETLTDEVTDEPSGIDEPIEGDNLPNIKKRRQRRLKTPKNGIDQPEDYEADKKQNDESSTEYNEIDTPSNTREYTEDEHDSETPEHDKNPDYNQSHEHEPEKLTDEVTDEPSKIDEPIEGVNQPNKRHRKRKDPKTGLEVSEEYDTLEEQDEESPLEDNKVDTPEHDENPKYNQSNEHEPEKLTGEVTDEPNEIEEPIEGVKQPNRRHRKRKDPKTGLEVSEEYDTLEEQDEESPLEDSKLDTPEHDENPEYNQSNEHEPEKLTDEVTDEPGEIEEPIKEIKQPNRRHRKRKDPKTGLEVSEEYDTLEEQDEESPLEDNKVDTPEHDENPEYNQSNEHEPEKLTDEVTDEPSGIDEPIEGDNLPNIKKRRQRRLKTPKNGIDQPEDYEADKKQNDESSTEYNEIDTPSNTREYTEDEHDSETPEHDKNPDYNQSHEHEPEKLTDEVTDEPSKIDEPIEGVNQPNKRHRKRKDPKAGLEVSEEYDTLEEQDEESPLEDNKVDTPEHDENPKYNQSNEHEPEKLTDEVTDEPNEIEEPIEGVKQPNRRHRKRKDPKTGLEVSEEYDTLEEQDEESPLEDSKLDTPEHDENPEYNQSNEHEPEKLTDEVTDEPSVIEEPIEGVKQPNRRHRKRKDTKTGLEVSEEYDTLEEQDEESPLEDNKVDTPEHDENPEYNQSNEHEPEKLTDEVTDEPSGIDEPIEGDNLPNIKKRRQRRLKTPKNGIEQPEDYEADKKQNDESSTEYNEIDTPSNTREYTEDEHDSETPEHDKNPDYNQSNEHEPEKLTDEVTDEPSKIDEPIEGVNQPNKSHRKRKDPKTDLEVSEEYDTLEEQDEESPLEDSKVDTPEHDENPKYNQSNEHEPEKLTDEVTDEPSEIEEPIEGVKQPNRRHRKRKDPKTGLEVSEEYDTLEEQDEESPLEDSKVDTPEHDENPEYNQSNEHESEKLTDEVTDEPSEIEEPIEGVKQPNRRHRKRKDPKTGLEVSEEYDTLEEQDEEPPLEDNKVDTPEHDENPDYNPSNEHEPEKLTDEVTDEPSEIEEPIEGVKQPNRRHRKRKDPKTGLEVSEEYDTLEEQDEESPLEDNKVDTPEHDENPEYNQSNEHEPEKLTDEVTDEPSGIDEPIEGDNLPNIKKRRQRRLKTPKNGIEQPEDYEADKKQNDESSTEYNEIDTPSNTREYTEDEHDSETPEHDENPDYNQSNDHEPEKLTDEVTDEPSKIDEPIEGVNHPNKRHRKRKDPMTGLEVSEEYDTLEEQDEEPPLEDNKVDTPEHDENPDYNPSNEHEPEKLTDEVTDEPSEIEETIEGVKQPNRRHRKRKDPKTGLEVSEEYDTLEEQDEESPLEDNKVDTPEHDENADYNQSNEHEPEKLTDEVTDEPSEIEEPIEGVKQPNRRHRKRKDPKTGLEVSEEYDTLEEQDEESPLDDNKVDTPEHDENPEYNQPNDVENNNDQPELTDYPENSDLLSKDSATPIDTNDNKNVVKPHPRKVRRRRKSKQPQSVYENDKTPIEVNDANINNYPVEDQNVNSKSIPYNNNDVNEEDPYNGYGDINNNESNKVQPELTEYPENSDLSSKDSATPIDTNDNENVVKPHPRKVRRRRKSKQPLSVYKNDKTPIEVNDENINNYPVEDQNVNSKSIPFNNNDVLEENPYNGYGDINNNESNKVQPELTEYPENSDLSSKDSATPIDTNDNENVVKPHPRKIRRRRKSKQPQSVYENDKKPIETNDVSTKITPTSEDAENIRVPNEEKSTETPEIDPKIIHKNPKKKRHIRRIRTYVVNKATNERIPINDQTYFTTDGLPDAINNKLDSLETEDSNVDDPDSNTDNDDYSSFLFKEYNSEQCKRDAYDRFKKVTSQDAKQIAYRSVLDTSEMRSNMLATIKNAISNVKASQTFNDVDQSLRTVSYSLKVGLKQTVSDLVIKVIPLAKDFLKTAENLKELYQKGPQSTHKMLINILENESTVPESAKDILRLISSQFDVDELINNIFEKPYNAKSLKEKKVKAQRKLIDLSKHMDTAISNIDCFVLSAMSTVGIGADTLKLLKSGKVIMSDKHPRAKTLRDAVGIIKAGKKIRNNKNSFTPTLTSSDGTTESDEDDDDEDPDQVAQKNEEFLKTVPDLDENIPISKKVPNKRQSLGVIVVHPDKQIEYKEVTDTSQLKKFVGDQTKKYKLQSKNKHPKFLKLNSKQLIDAMVADVKKKAERNGMTKKEMVDEIIKNLNSS